MSETADQYMQRIRSQRFASTEAEYIALLERELEERLRVNVGLLIENTASHSPLKPYAPPEAEQLLRELENLPVTATGADTA